MVPQPGLNRFAVHVRNKDRLARVTMDVRATCLRVAPAPLTRYDVPLQYMLILTQPRF